MSAERDIKREILAVLHAHGIIAFRVHSGQVRVRRGWMHLAPAGTPDIVAIVPPHGRFLGLEVKTEDGTERPGQLDFAKGARRHGAAVVTVRSSREAIAAWQAAKARHGAT